MSLRRRVFWSAVWCSVGFHLRSVMQWWIESGGEIHTLPELPVFRRRA